MKVTLPLEPVGSVASVLPAAAVVVSVSARTGTSEGVHGGFAVQSATLSLRRVAVDTYDYDAAGRMTSRTVDSVTTALGWDVLSNLTSTSSTSSLADSRIYAYDASGQRVAQIVVNAVAPGAVASKVTAYVGDLEVTDADGLANSTGVSATRFLTFGGATVATVTSGSPTPTWSLMLGDGQGSAQVAMKLVPQAPGTGLEPASASHTVTRNAYMPFGATRGGDNLATSRGWLGQVADTDTALIYLNARYYDPVLARFVSPDPLMNPGDPKTLDPYRYADNNPVMMTDATGLEPRVWDDGRIVGLPTSSKPKWNLSPKALVIARLHGEHGAAKGLLNLIKGGPSLIDGAKLWNQNYQAYRSDPKGTWDKNFAIEKSYVVTYFGVGQEWNCALIGQCSLKDAWHDTTHSWMMAHVGENYDRKDLNALMETGGEGAIYGVAIVAGPKALSGLGARSAAAGAADAASLELQAIAARDALAAASTPRTATVVGGWDAVTGRVGTGASGLGLCAETACANSLIAQGSDIANIRFTDAFRPRTGNPVEVCHMCQSLYGLENFGPNAKLKDGGMLAGSG